MKKRILAAAVCAVMVLSLTACGKSGNIVEEFLSQTGKEASSKPVSTAMPTPNNTSSTLVSSSATCSAPVSSSITSSTPESKPDLAADWEYSKNGTSGTITLTKYKGTSEKVIIPSEIDGLKVEGLLETFYNNIDVTSVTVPESVVDIRWGAFAYCINLNEIIFKGDIRINVSAEDNQLDVFKDTPWLEAKKAENPDFLIINNVLVACSVSGEVTIPNGIKKIASLAFAHNLYITSVTIPDGVTELGSMAFGYCFNLKSVVLPDSVTVIRNQAFYGDDSLQSITLPDSIKELYPSAFDRSNTEVVYKGFSYKGTEEYKRLAMGVEFGDKDFIITDNVLIKANPIAKKIELPDTVKDISESAFKDADNEIIIVYRGKNYNLSNFDKLKAAVRGS